jgi:hypothetical protein
MTDVIKLKKRALYQPVTSDIPPPRDVVLTFCFPRSRSSSVRASDASSARSPISEHICTCSARNPPEYVHTQAFVTAFHPMAGVELRRAAEFLDRVGQVARVRERRGAQYLERSLSGERNFLHLKDQKIFPVGQS